MSLPLARRCLVDDRLTRRAWLRVAALGGWATPIVRGTSRARAGAAAAGDGLGRARSVVLIFANGGQSQLDMWDPKPLAPEDVRGAFRSIPTSVPGLHFCEHLPKIARLADRLTVIRSMSHEDIDHGSAAYLALTGSYHVRRSSNPAPSATDAPTYGAVVRRLTRDRRFVFDAVQLNGPVLVPVHLAPGQDGGFLGRAYEPLVVGDVTTAAGAIPGLAPQADLSRGRMAERLTLKQALDQLDDRWTACSAATDLQRQYAKSLELLGSPVTRAAFQLDAEPPAVRERYGLHRSGQALLLARRLVEAGVPWIHVNWNHSNRGQDQTPDDTDAYGWDTHNDIFDALRDRLLPRFDQSFSALLEDLDQRGLLADTLVVCLGEFGRAPRVALEPKFAGATPGRKHWATVYSIVMAGAGVTRGGVVGASDRLGAEPVTERYGPWDVAATMYHALGIDPNGHYSDPTGRTFPIAHGRPISSIYRG